MCAKELARGESCDAYIKYCMGRVRLLQRHGVTPLLVFDGGRLPAKLGTEQARAASRREAKARAEEMLERGEGDKAYSLFAKSVDVTPDMCRRVMQHLQAAGVQYLVAPYEADAQLAYLAAKGIVQGVITEDSDTIPYGCPAVLFKMDKEGRGQLYRRDALDSVPAGRISPLVPRGLSKLQMVAWCVLAGCDYLPSLSGVGVKVALRKLEDARRWLRSNFTVEEFLKRMKYHGLPGFDAAYSKQFLMAVHTFHHQRVYCPEAKRVVCLSPLPAAAWSPAHDALAASTAQGVSPDALQWLPHGYHWPDAEAAQLDFLGPLLPPDMAQGVAEGAIHPETLQPYPPELLAAVSDPPMAAAPSTAASSGVGQAASAPTPRSSLITSFLVQQRPQSSPEEGSTPLSRTDSAGSSSQGGHKRRRSRSCTSTTTPEPDAVGSEVAGTASRYFAKPTPRKAARTTEAASPAVSLAPFHYGDTPELPVRPSPSTGTAPGDEACPSSLAGHLRKRLVAATAPPAGTPSVSGGTKSLLASFAYSGGTAPSTGASSSALPSGPPSTCRSFVYSPHTSCRGASTAAEAVAGDVAKVLPFTKSQGTGTVHSSPSKPRRRRAGLGRPRQPLLRVQKPALS